MPVPGDEQDPEFHRQLREALQRTDPRELSPKLTPAEAEELKAKLKAKKPPRVPKEIEFWFFSWCFRYAPPEIWDKGKGALREWLQTNGIHLEEPEPGHYQIWQRDKVLCGAKQI